MEHLRHVGIRYQDPQGNWSDKPTNAIRRLRAEVSAQVTPVAELIVEEKQGNKWITVTKEAPLLDQGGWWRAYRQRWNGKNWMVCQGARPMDEELWIKTGKPDLYKLDGQKCIHPVEAGYQFMVPVEDASRWAKKIQAAGGAIVRWDPQEQPVQEALGKIEQALSRIEEANVAGEKIMAQVEKGDRLALLKLDLDGGKFPDLTNALESAWDGFNTETRVWTAREEELGRSAQIIQLNQQAHKLYQQGQEGLQRLLALRLRAAALLLPNQDSGASSSRNLFISLALLFAQNGVASHVEENGLRLQLADGKEILIQPDGVQII